MHYLDKLNFRYKVVICGNHEISFDRNVDPKVKEKRKYSISEVKIGCKLEIAGGITEADQKTLYISRA